MVLPKDELPVNNDCVEIGGGWRAEGTGPHEQASDKLIRYEWNTRFEPGFPGDPLDAGGQQIWMVFTQWHQKDPADKNPRIGVSPPIAFIVDKNELRLVLNRVDNAHPDQSVEVGRYDLAPFTTDVWHHWRAEIRWSLTDGSVKVWHDGTVVQELAHVQTIFPDPDSPGQLDKPGDSYLKVGLYRKPMDHPGPWVLWHDEFKRLEQGNAAQLPHSPSKLPTCLN
jgi:hypothetical protein